MWSNHRFPVILHNQNIHFLHLAHFPHVISRISTITRISYKNPCVKVLLLNCSFFHGLHRFKLIPVQANKLTIPVQAVRVSSSVSKTISCRIRRTSDHFHSTKTRSPSVPSAVVLSSVTSPACWLRRRRCRTLVTQWLRDVTRLRAAGRDLWAEWSARCWLPRMSNECPAAALNLPELTNKKKDKLKVWDYCAEHLEIIVGYLIDTMWCQWCIAPVSAAVMLYFALHQLEENLCSLFTMN